MGFSRPEHRWQSEGRGRLTRNWIASIVLAVGALLLVNTGPAMALTLTSSAFEPGGTIASNTLARVTISSPLSPSPACRQGPSLALIVDDPDVPDPKAPKRVWVHWLVYNLPPDSQGLPENASGAGLPGGATTEGEASDSTDHLPRALSADRPAPLFSKLYALDIALRKAAHKPELEAAMKGHVLAQAELIGTYKKGDR